MAGRTELDRFARHAVHDGARLVLCDRQRTGAPMPGSSRERMACSASGPPVDAPTATMRGRAPAATTAFGGGAATGSLSALRLTTFTSDISLTVRSSSVRAVM